MREHKNQFWRLIQLGMIIIIVSLTLACYSGPALFANKRNNKPTQTNQVLPQKPGGPSTDLNQPQKAVTVTVPEPVQSPILKPTVVKKYTPLPTAVASDVISSFDGNYNGVLYSVLYPGDFSHTSSNGWELFCLTTDKSLCVTVHPRNGNWNDAKELADEVMGEVRKKTSNMVIYDEKSTTTNMDGFPAYWIGARYTYKGVENDSSNLFVVIQHIGFEIAADGETQKVEAYRRILDSIMNSFQLLYN